MYAGRKHVDTVTDFLIQHGGESIYSEELSPDVRKQLQLFSSNDFMHITVIDRWANNGANNGNKSNKLFDLMLSFCVYLTGLNKAYYYFN